MTLLLLIACHRDRAPDQPDDAPETVWDSSRTLAADTTVPSGEVLVIEPGVTVTLAEGVSLVVQGELRAEGTEVEPITFTGEAWGSIVFEAGASDAVFAGVGEYASGSLLDHVIIERATRGMTLRGASPYLHAVTFQYNELPGGTDTIGGAALLVSDGASPRIRDCVFQDNVVNLFGFGGAIYADHADPIIQDSRFVGNTSTYGGAIATDWMASPIVGSEFADNVSQSEGGGLSLISSVSAVLASSFTGNTAKKDGAGVHVCLDCDPHAAPTFMDDVITGNISDNADPDDGAAGLGAAFLTGIQDVEIHDNLRDGQPSDLGWFNLVSEAWPEWIASPDLSGVWWGTTDGAEIEATIWDGADNPDYGLVRLESVAQAAPAGPIPRVVLASRRQRYQDAGEAVPVFLTLYNPGEEVTVHLALTRQGSAFDGDITFPGAVAEGEGWTLTLPQGAVWFETLEQEPYDGVSTDDITWEAHLTDAQTGAAIGVTSAARYVFSPLDAQ